MDSKFESQIQRYVLNWYGLKSTDQVVTGGSDPAKKGGSSQPG